MTKLIKQDGRMRRSRLALLAGFAIVAATALVAVSVGTAAPAAKPSVTAPPTITGTTKVDSTLTASDGTWAGGGNMTFAYQWTRCDKDGGSCSNISGATTKTYTLKTVDKDNTLRVRVTATNADGSTGATSVPTGVVAAADATPTPTPTPTPTSDGCPKTTQANAAVSVTDVTAPARLLVDKFTADPGRITLGVRSFTVRIHVSNTCGQSVKGATVFANAVPYNQINSATQPTGDDGWAQLSFSTARGFPAATKQQLLVMFVRASKPGEPILAGISTRRLVSLPVSLHG